MGLFNALLMTVAQRLLRVRPNAEVISWLMRTPSISTFLCKSPFVIIGCPNIKHHRFCWLEILQFHPCFQLVEGTVDFAFYNLRVRVAFMHSHHLSEEEVHQYILAPQVLRYLGGIV